MIRLVKMLDKNWGVAGAMSWDVYYQLLNLPGLNGFHQSGQPGTDWCFIEFWCSDQSLILDRVLEVLPDIDF